MRVRRSVAVLVLVITMTSAGALEASAVPPPVLPHPPPIAATFTLHPDSGPVGTKVTMHGACGFAAHQLLWGIEVPNESGEITTVWFPPEWPLLTPTPLGVFTVTFTFPSTGNFPGYEGVPLLPGGYFVGGICYPGPISEGGGIPMPPQLFTLTAAKR
jgi:hypothetical protein